MALVPTIDPHRYSKNPGGKFVSDEVALFFEGAGLMTPPENNKRKVSTALDAYPGDFGGCRAYFTPQWQTTNRVAMWFKHIVPLAEMTLLQIAIPNNSHPERVPEASLEMYLAQWRRVQRNVEEIGVECPRL